MKKILFVFGLLFVFQSCRKDVLPETDELQPEEGEELLGGTLTVFDATPNAFGHQLPGLTTQEGLDFFTGRSFFNQNWVTAPSSTAARDGLGPLFNSRACGGCHFQDGRGRPPFQLGDLGTGFLVRLSIPGNGVHGEPLPDPNYGGQFQDDAIQGVAPEVAIDIQYVELSGYFPDGEPYSLRVPQYVYQALAYGTTHSDIMYSPRIAQQMIGLGLLEYVPESDVISRADEFDADGDGISGRPNYVWDAHHQQTMLGRYGWKANTASLYHQTAGAFLGDMGITTDLFPNENCTSAELDCQSAANGGTPEISTVDLEKVVLYTKTLAVPARRNWTDPDVLSGKQLFTQIGCAKCHTPKMQTGLSDIAVISNQTIRPYTDLLLHDMGPALADGRPDFLASGNEWRTPPLWGIGLIPVVNGHSFYLHDGRARNLQEAILWHGGEAENARLAYMQLSAAQRNQLIRFLESL
jgi:CxxC motif-containing protein (DUF1111 family)